MAGVPRPARRVPAAVLIGTALLLQTVGLGGCARPDGPAADPAAATAESEPTPENPPYQDRLTRVDRELGAAFDRVRVARDPDTLAQAVMDAAGVSTAAGERMRSGPVDPAVARANSALADSLTQLARELAFLSQRVHDHEVCTGPAALDAIATAPTMPALRAVAAGLALPGADGRTYRWGGSLPPVRDDLSTPPPPLANGRILVDHRAPGPAPGDGVLEARNEGPDPAVVVLARDGAALLTMAIAPAQTARVSGVPDGVYQLAYTAGQDWDAGAGAFSRGCQFRRFTAPTPFQTQQTPAGIGYTVRTVVIRPGPPDAATTDIPAGQLPG